MAEPYPFVTVALACQNGGTCTPGTTHLFPAVQQWIDVPKVTQVRQVGSETVHTICAGQRARVVDHLPGAHQVLAQLEHYHVSVWFDLADLRWTLKPMTSGLRT